MFGGSIIALAGGVGGAKLCEGLFQTMIPENLNIIVNTGDDATFYGLHISPDIDIMLYTLAGLVHKKRRWGFQDDSFRALHALARFYEKPWFHIGDKDLATHIYRTDLLNHGHSLTKVTSLLAQKFGLKAKIYPATDNQLQTIVQTPQGDMEFQEYFVKYRFSPKVKSIKYDGAQNAHIGENVKVLFRQVEKIIICPSNPWLSIGPILAIPDIKLILQEYRTKIWIVSPIIAGQALKGPTRDIMETLGFQPTCVGVAQYYHDLLGDGINFIIDNRDVKLCPNIEALDMHCIATNIIMGSMKIKRDLARLIYRS